MINGYFFFFNSVCLFCLDIQREEKNVQKAIKDAAKRNDMSSAKVLSFFFSNFNLLCFAIVFLRKID